MNPSPEPWQFCVDAEVIRQVGPTPALVHAILAAYQGSDGAVGATCEYREYSTPVRTSGGASPTSAQRVLCACSMTSRALSFCHLAKFACIGPTGQLAITGRRHAAE
jgi:hypothetical protein